MKEEGCLLSVILPVFNEYEVIELFFKTLKLEIDKTGMRCEIIFVDDGSTDESFTEIKKIINKYPCYSFKAIQFSRNFGHQMALFAGIKESEGDYIIMMDTDLQHPPYIIHELLRYALDGYDVVSTIREENPKVGFLKKITSKYFYMIFNFLTGLNMENTADFRLISRKVCETLTAMDERDIFLRGIFIWIGFMQKAIYYKADERKYGKTKYNFRRMFSFAWSGITSFSIKPIRISLIMCAFSAIVAVLYISYALYVKFILKTAIQGWTSILILNSLFFLCVFIMLGIIGEYIGKIHIETKKRPMYIIKQVITTKS